MAETVLAKLAVQVGANTADFQKGIKASSKEFDSFSRQVKKSGNNFSGLGKSIIAGLGAAAIISTLKNIGSQVVDITSEFQKFEAVLKNTLGSDSAAAIALSNIQEFAAKTPFAVSELTSAFVKLANQGFEPTVDEMRSLGDLASSTGKSFDQLAEAVIDAQVGEFERLKEFGVRAKKSGDQVTFTFKGVSTTVKNTSKDIQDYVLSLGDAEGVTGSMAMISETLGGSISNLGDAWDNFLRTLGDGNKGPLQNAVKNLSLLLSVVTEWVETDQQKIDKAVTKAQAGAVALVKALAQNYDGDIKKAAEEYTKVLQKQVETLHTLELQVDRIDDDGNSIEGAKEKAKAYQLQRLQLEGQIIAINDLVKAESKNNSTTQVQIGLIEQLEKQLKELEASKKAAFTEKEIANLNVRIEETQERIKRLNELGNNKGLIPSLQAQIDALQKAISRSFDPSEIIDFTQQIEILQDRIQQLQSIGQINILSKIGLDDFNFESYNKKFDEATKLTSEKVSQFASQVSADVARLTKTGTEAAKQMIDLGPMVANGIVGLADALGTALATQDFAGFGDAILEAVASFAQQLGAQMVALGVAELALKFASANPIALIAAGAALVAAGAAVKSSLSKQKDVISGAGGGSSSGSSGGYTSSNVSSVNSSAQDVNITVEGVIRGEDLYIIGSTYDRNSRFTRTTGG